VLRANRAGFFGPQRSLQRPVLGTEASSGAPKELQESEAEHTRGLAAQHKLISRQAALCGA